MSRKALGFDESESEEEEVLPNPKRQNVRTNKDMIAQSLRNQSKSIQHEEENSEIYHYDEVYDDIKAQEEIRKPKLQDDGEAKYIGKLLEAKRQRNMDKLYIQDLKVQKERELEGDEFKDKESFVTSAYKEFQQERLKEENESRNSVPVRGITNIETHSQARDQDNKILPESSSIQSKSDLGAGLNLKGGLNVPSKTKPQPQELESKFITNTTQKKSVLLPKLSEDEIQQYRERYLQRKAKKT